MNKTQIIAPLVAMGIAAMVFGVIQGRRNYRNYRYFLSYRAEQVGLQLVKTTNSTVLRDMPDGLRNKLSTFLEVPARIDTTSYGDAPAPIGDGKADICLFLKNDQGERLGIRLRLDGEPGQFHVLGFWTP